MQPLIVVFALLCGLLFGQAPEFMQQYHQRLGGTADELTLIVRHFEEDAKRSGYSLGIRALQP